MVMAKITFIGAGSVVFTRNLVGDIITHPELAGSEISLMDIDHERVGLVGRFVRSIIEQEGADLKVSSTTSRRDALRGANYVILTFRVDDDGNLRRSDIDIPLKYGVGQSIGDTLTPGGIFAGLRHLVVIEGVARDMQELCPDALVLQYSNPMAILTWSLLNSGIRAVGLCHSVQGTAAQLAGFLGLEPDDVEYWVAGINHSAWFLALRERGPGHRDLLPLLRERLNSSDELYGKDPIRIEMFRRFGYFVTESSPHSSEYFPYFRKNEGMIEAWGEQYDPVPEGAMNYNRGRTLQNVVQRQEQRNNEFKDILLEQLEGHRRHTVKRSSEYGARIMAAIESNVPLRINGNVRNDNLISNLPEGCCVEVPCLVDGLGVHPCVVGGLPTPLAALNRTHVNVQELVVEGYAKKDRSLIYDAMALDPLTATVCTLEEIHRLTNEMFAFNEKWINI